MNIKDIPISVKRAGYFAAIFPLGDEHWVDPERIHEKFHWIKEKLCEVRRLFKVPIIHLKLGDDLEYDRASYTEKLRGLGKPHDKRGHESNAKYLVNRLIKNYAGMFAPEDIKGGGVAGNHKVEFSVGHKELYELIKKGNSPWLNSTHMICNRLGMTYMGEGHGLINLHIRRGCKRRIHRILITHGAGRGSGDAADFTEFTRIRKMYGDLDCIIKAHSHKPMTAHWGRYDTNMSENSKSPRVKETLIVNVGSIRDGMELGNADYPEKNNMSPIPIRFPIILLYASQHKPGTIEIIQIPITF